MCAALWARCACPFGLGNLLAVRSWNWCWHIPKWRCHPLVEMHQARFCARNGIWTPMWLVPMLRNSASSCVFASRRAQFHQRFVSPPPRLLPHASCNEVSAAALLQTMASLPLQLLTLWMEHSSRAGRSPQIDFSVSEYNNKCRAHGLLQCEGLQKRH